jgi:hypothetical protein
MVAEDDRPIGAPVLPVSRRDRLSVWVAAHRWAVPIIRLAAGLIPVAVLALVFGADFPLAKVIAFVICAVLGDKIGEREKERGDALRDFPVPPDSLPGEFAEYFHQPPDPRSDGRYIRPQ